MATPTSADPGLLDGDVVTDQERKLMAIIDMLVDTVVRQDDYIKELRSAQ